MTLNDIIVSALGQLDRSHDSQTMDVWRERFKDYANEAAYEIAKALGAHYSEVASVEDGEIDLTALSKPCVKVISVTQHGHDVDHTTGSATGRMRVNADGEVVVDYRFKPKDLENPTDKPDLPEYTHRLIYIYVVARERSSQDASVQRGANVYFEMFQSGLADLRKNAGEKDKYKIINKW